MLLAVCILIPVLTSIALLYPARARAKTLNLDAPRHLRNWPVLVYAPLALIALALWVSG